MEICGILHPIRTRRENRQSMYEAQKRMEAEEADEYRKNCTYIESLRTSLERVEIFDGDLSDFERIKKCNYEVIGLVVEGVYEPRDSLYEAFNLESWHETSVEPIELAVPRRMPIDRALPERRDENGVLAPRKEELNPFRVLPFDIRIQAQKEHSDVTALISLERESTLDFLETFQKVHSGMVEFRTPPTYFQIGYYRAIPVRPTNNDE